MRIPAGTRYDGYVLSDNMTAYSSDEKIRKKALCIYRRRMIFVIINKQTVNCLQSTLTSIFHFTALRCVFLSPELTMKGKI